MNSRKGHFIWSGGWKFANKHDLKVVHRRYIKQMQHLKYISPKTVIIKLGSLGVLRAICQHGFLLFQQSVHTLPHIVG